MILVMAMRVRLSKGAETVPLWLGGLLLRVSQRLGVKPAISYLGYMYTFELDPGYDPMAPDISQIHQRYCFTGTLDESIFIGTSLIATILLERINQTLLELTPLNEKAGLAHITEMLQVVIRKCEELYERMDADYFYK